MTTRDCENVCMAAMAIVDGHQPEWSSQEIEAHLERCHGCRLEVQQMRKLSTLLDGTARRQQTADLWKHVESELSVETQLPRAAAARTVSGSWGPLMVLGVLLIGYRIIEMVPDRDFGFLLKLIPVLLVVAAFLYLRENPFKVNAELRLEGE